MEKKVILSSTMTEAQFDCGYWYAAELRAFAKEIGIPSASKLRKDELEIAVKTFLRSDKKSLPTKRKLTQSGPRDVSCGLSLELRVVNYTNDKQTKAFIVNEAQKLVPGLKEKSGVRYRLNRWREEQITDGVELTYGDLVGQYIRLCQVEGRFPHVPVGRYINFVADFLANEADGTRQDAIEAWKQLKNRDCPKTYTDWKQQEH